MVYTPTRPPLDYYERKDRQNVVWRDELREQVLETVAALPPPLPPAELGAGWTMEGDRAYRWQGPQDGEPELVFSNLLQDHRYRVTFHLSQFDGDGALVLRLGDGTDVVSASLEGFYVEAADLGTDDSSARLVVSTGTVATDIRVLGLVIEDLGPITEPLIGTVTAWAANLVAMEVEGGEPPYTVDWGDGTVETSSDPTFGHTYATAGVKQIEISDPDAKTYTLYTHVTSAPVFPIALTGGWSQIAGAGFHLSEGAALLQFGPYEPDTPVTLQFALWGADDGAGSLALDLGDGTPALTLDLTTATPGGHVVGGFVGDDGYLTFSGTDATEVQLMELSILTGDAA